VVGRLTYWATSADAMSAARAEGRGDPTQHLVSCKEVSSSEAI
jgi:hypothetical protein